MKLPNLKAKVKPPGAHMFEGDHAWTVLEKTGDKLLIACPCGAFKFVEARELE